MPGGYDPARDPTRVTAQPALTSSHGRVWLIVGAVFCVIALAVLGALLTVQAAIAAPAMVVVLGCYIAMVVIRIAVRARRPRLYALAIVFGAMVAAALVAVLLIAGSVAPPVA